MCAQISMKYSRIGLSYAKKLYGGYFFVPACLSSFTSTNLCSSSFPESDEVDCSPALNKLFKEAAVY